MRKPVARSATAWPMRPMPTMPRRLPDTRVPSANLACEPDGRRGDNARKLRAVRRQKALRVGLVGQAGHAVARGQFGFEGGQGQAAYLQDAGLGVGGHWMEGNLEC